MSTSPRVVLTAGHLRSGPVEALGELLLRQGAQVSGVLAVSVFSPARIRALLRQRGAGFLGQAVRRALGWGTRSAAAVAAQPLAEYYASKSLSINGLRRFCRAKNVPLAVVPSLNSPAALAFLGRVRPDLVIYGGGGILRGPFLDAAGRVLNAHAGPLPAIRGMNAAEWSALLDQPAEATIHLIDRGIDTGPVLLRMPYDRARCRSVDELRDRAVVAGLEGLLRCVAEGTWNAPGEASAPNRSRQCFVLAPVLREVLDARLRASGARP